MSQELTDSQQRRRTGHADLVQRAGELREEIVKAMETDSPSLTTFATDLDKAVSSIQEAIAPRVPRPPPPLEDENPKKKARKAAGDENGAKAKSSASERKEKAINVRVGVIMAAAMLHPLSIDEFVDLWETDFATTDAKDREDKSLTLLVRGYSAGGEGDKDEQDLWVIVMPAAGFTADFPQYDAFQDITKSEDLSLGEILSDYKASKDEPKDPAALTVWAVGRHRTLVSHESSNRTLNHARRIAEAIAAVEFGIVWEGQPKSWKTSTFCAMFRDTAEHKDNFAGLDDEQADDLIKTDLKTQFKSFKDKLGFTITARNRLVWSPRLPGSTVVDGRTPSASAFRVFNSILAEMPHDPDMKEHTTAVSRYKGNLQATVGVLRAIDTGLARHFWEFLKKRPNNPALERAKIRKAAEKEGEEAGRSNPRKEV
ncbi:hypothetical protein C8R47DRAFT_1078967 [Mycena vitilis]|nr:hypothetical protein C8R47DRAFT_1078967 [Mycena vitilis]